MRCPNCQSELPPQAKFCFDCGTKVGSSSLSGDEPGLAGASILQHSLHTISDPKPSTASSSSQPLSSRYELHEEIGRGGFAVVYRATDLRLGRDVAVKRLQAQAIAGPLGQQTLERFEREAQAIAGLNHQNIVTVFDHEKDEAGVYVVMEYVEGGTLREHLKQSGGKLPVAEAVELIKGVARGLAYAHRKNLVHRDIKPANILLARGSNELTPKIVDFGLARVGTDSEVSISGQGMGTPWYMPPEQRRNAKGVNHTADIYALGKTLYELVSGEVPDNVDPEKIPEPWLTAVILRCIKSRPEERYFSAEELLDNLQKGGGVQHPKTEIIAEDANQCPSCSLVNPSGLKYCRKCGTGLTRVCPECAFEESVHAKFCGKCGTEVDRFMVWQQALIRMKQSQEKADLAGTVKQREKLEKEPFNPKGKKGKSVTEEITELYTIAKQEIQKREELEKDARAALQSGDLGEVLRYLGTLSQTVGGLNEQQQQLRNDVRVALQQHVHQTIEQQLNSQKWETAIKELEELREGLHWIGQKSETLEQLGDDLHRQLSAGVAKALEQAAESLNEQQTQKAVDENRSKDALVLSGQLMKTKGTLSRSQEVLRLEAVRQIESGIETAGTAALAAESWETAIKEFRAAAESLESLKQDSDVTRALGDAWLQEHETQLRTALQNAQQKLAEQQTQRAQQKLEAAVRKALANGQYEEALQEFAGAAIVPLDARKKLCGEILVSFEHSFNQTFQLHAVDNNWQVATEIVDAALNNLSKLKSGLIGYGADKFECAALDKRLRDANVKILQDSLLLKSKRMLIQAEDFFKKRLWVDSIIAAKDLHKLVGNDTYLQEYAEKSTKLIQLCEKSSQDEVRWNLRLVGICYVGFILLSGFVGILFFGCNNQHNSIDAQIFWGFGIAICSLLFVFAVQTRIRKGATDNNPVASSALAILIALLGGIAGWNLAENHLGLLMGIIGGAVVGIGPCLLTSLKIISNRRGFASQKSMVRSILFVTLINITIGYEIKSHSNFPAVVLPPDKPAVNQPQPGEPADLPSAIPTEKKPSFADSPPRLNRRIPIHQLAHQRPKFNQKMRNIRKI